MPKNTESQEDIWSTQHTFQYVDKGKHGFSGSCLPVE